MYPPPSHCPQGRWGRTFHASSPSSGGWSGKRRGCEMSERWRTSALMFFWGVIKMMMKKKQQQRGQKINNFRRRNNILKENIVLDDVCMTINEFQSFDLITDQIQEHKVSEFLRKFLLSYLQLFPTSMSFRTSSVHLTSFSCSPTTCTCCFPSSSTLSLALRFSRSNTYKHSSVSIK